MNIKDKVQNLIRKRIICPSKFRFVIVIGSSDDLYMFKKELKLAQSDTKHIDIRLKYDNYWYSNFKELLINNKNSIFYFDNFIEIIKEPNFYNPFNQRRDYFSQKLEPNLICFVEEENKEYLFQNVLNVIPDSWEFRTATIYL